MLRLFQKPLTFQDPSQYHPDEFVYARAQLEKIPQGMGGQADLSLLYTLIKYSQPQYILETGVSFGWSSLVILCALNASLARRPSCLVSIDMPHSWLNNARMSVGKAVPESLHNNWILIRKPDIIGLRDALRVTKIDFCHYDSDKTYLGKYISLLRVWRYLNPNGLLVVDDAADNMACIHFAEKIGCEPLVLRTGSKYVAIFVK